MPALIRANHLNYREFFKVGIYVRDIKEAEKYLRQKNAVIKHGAFEDRDTQTTSLVIEDVNRNLIQIIQRP